MIPEDVPFPCVLRIFPPRLSVSQGQEPPALWLTRPERTSPQMGGRTCRGGAGCWPAAAERSDPSAASPLAAHHRVSADFPAHAPDPAREAGLTHSPLRQQKDLEDGAGRAAGHSGRQPHAHSQPISAPSFSLSLAPRHVTVAARKPVPPPDLLLPHTPPDAYAPSYMSADCRSQNRTRRNCSRADRSLCAGHRSASFRRDNPQNKPNEMSSGVAVSLLQRTRTNKICIKTITYLRKRRREVF